jgi:hypothetical protein
VKCTTGKGTEAVFEQSRRDQRIAVFETIGCALATLRRLGHIWYDEDIRTAITAARSNLSIAQSKVKQRIDE